MQSLLAARSTLQLTSVRYKSLKYIRRPWARPYKRRVYEELMKPIAPRAPQLSMAESCKENDAHRAARPPADKLGEIEEALVQHIRRQLVENRVMAVCHSIPVTEEVYATHKRLMRLHDLELRHFPSHILRAVVDGTRLANLKPLFVTEMSTDILLGPSLHSIGHIIKELEKRKHLVLMAMVADNKIMTPAEAREFALHADPALLPAHTVSLLQQVPMGTTELLERSTRSLSQMLEARQGQLGGDGEKPKDGEDRS